MDEAASEHPQRLSSSQRGVALVLTFVAYVAVVQLFPVVSVAPENVALLWLPNAVVAVALFRTERRWWWSVWVAGLLGEVVGDAFHGIAPLEALWFGVVNMVEATLVVLAVERFGGRSLMRTARSVAAFILAAMTVPAVSGMFGALGSVVAFGSRWLDAWQAWWFGDAIGLVVGVPIGIAVFDFRAGVAVERSRAVLRELAMGALAAASLAVALSFDGRPGPSQHLAIAVGVILALGLGALGAAVGGTLVAVITIVPAVREIGTLSVVESQGFLLVVSAAVLFVGAVIESEHTTVVALARSEARLRTTFEDAPIGMAITDLAPERFGRWLEVNAALVRLLGRNADDLLGTHPTSLLHVDDRGPAAGPAAVGAGGHTDTERRYRHADGRYVWCRVVESVVLDPASGEASFTVTQLVDVTATKKAAAELTHAAMHDPLTGLPNRTLLMDRLALRLRGLARSRDLVAVMYVDIDHFKAANDAFGHAAGDALLVEVSQRLRSAVRPGDTVARIGGDEFVIVCGGINSVDRVVQVAERVSAQLDRPTTIFGRVIDLSGSVGVAVTRNPDHDPSELVQAADAAMYQAKAGGRRRFELFDENSTPVR